MTFYTYKIHVKNFPRLFRLGEGGYHLISSVAVIAFAAA